MGGDKEVARNKKEEARKRTQCWEKEQKAHRAATRGQTKTFNKVGLNLIPRRYYLHVT